MLWKKFKDFHILTYLFQTHSSGVLPHDDRDYLMFLASYKVSITNSSYTEGDGSVEPSLVFCKLYSPYSK